MSDSPSPTVPLTDSWEKLARDLLAWSTGIVNHGGDYRTEVEALVAFRLRLPALAAVPALATEREAGTEMPQLRCPWRVLGSDGDEVRQGYDRETVMRECLPSAQRDRPGGSFRVVRLAVVEVAAPVPSAGEPEATLELRNGWATVRQGAVFTLHATRAEAEKVVRSEYTDANGVRGDYSDACVVRLAVVESPAPSEGRGEAPQGAATETGKLSKGEEESAMIWLAALTNHPDQEQRAQAICAELVIESLRAALTAAEQDYDKATELAAGIIVQRDEAVTLAGEVLGDFAGHCGECDDMRGDLCKHYNSFRARLAKLNKEGQ